MKCVVCAEKWTHCPLSGPFAEVGGKSYCYEHNPERHRDSSKKKDEFSGLEEALQKAVQDRKKKTDVFIAESLRWRANDYVFDLHVVSALESVAKAKQEEEEIRAKLISFF